MIGSFGGEGGEFFLVFLFVRKEDHLNRSINMKAKMVKTKVWSNMDVTFGTKNCRKFDIFFSFFRASVCLFWVFKVYGVSLVDFPIFNFYIYIKQRWIPMSCPTATSILFRADRVNSCDWRKIKIKKTQKGKRKQTNALSKLHLTKRRIYNWARAKPGMIETIEVRM